MDDTLPVPPLFLMETFSPDSVLDPSTAFDPIAARATLHNDVLKFLHLTNTEMVEIYSAQNKAANKGALLEILNQKVNHFLWCGTDFIATVDRDGKKEMTVIEVNTTPLGPMAQAGSAGMIGYNRLIEYGFVPWLKNIPQSDGDLAIMFDHCKSSHEVHVFAKLTANLTGEYVHLCNLDAMLQNGSAKWLNNKLLIKKPDSSSFTPIRAAFRKVASKPWAKISVNCKTPFFNPVLISVAGGQNKLLAIQAYEDFNSRMIGTNLSIPTPYTTGPWSKDNLAEATKEFAYPFVIKCPFINRGAGIYMITSEEDLNALISCSLPYDQFIVQSMIAPESWKKQKNGLFPRPMNIKGNNYMYDLRVMIVNGINGWRPAVVFGRRAPTPLTVKCPTDRNEAENMMKTNLTIGAAKGGNEMEMKRVITMDQEQFEMLGITLEDMVEAYVNSVLAAVAIDDMCEKLIDENNEFNEDLFYKLHQGEIMRKEIEEGKTKCS